VLVSEVSTNTQFVTWRLNSLENLLRNTGGPSPVQAPSILSTTEDLRS
jgi:hypothetical protein